MYMRAFTLTRKTGNEAREMSSVRDLYPLPNLVYLLLLTCAHGNTHTL